MRVLAIVVAVALVAALACYNPTLQDCQFQCGSGGTCPDGYNCAAGNLCRPPGATGACPAGTTDGALGCPSISLNMCATPTAFAGSDCATSCSSPRTWNLAAMDCSNATASGWRLAFLNTLARLEAAPPAGTALWVGAIGSSSNSSSYHWTADTSVVLLAEWDTGYPMAAAAPQSCVYAVTSGSGKNRLRNQEGEPREQS